VKGFVWKAHERHTAELCQELPAGPVRAIGSASLNAWASARDVMQAVNVGARWVWGPTLASDSSVGWNLPLPGWWDKLAEQLAASKVRLVLATGHLGAEGRHAFAGLAGAHEHLLCSITHSLYVPVEELAQLADYGCAFEIDAYTLVTNIEGRRRSDLGTVLDRLTAAGVAVYFTSDGGQEATGNPFLFGARVLAQVATLVGADSANDLGVRNPAALVEWLDGSAS
jgi:hypothetical protein